MYRVQSGWRKTVTASILSSSAITSPGDSNHGNRSKKNTPEVFREKTVDAQPVHQNPLQYELGRLYEPSVSELPEGHNFIVEVGKVAVSIGQRLQAAAFSVIRLLVSSGSLQDIEQLAQSWVQWEFLVEIFRRWRLEPVGSAMVMHVNFCGTNSLRFCMDLVVSRFSWHLN